jgi:hypothetical protein
MLLSTERLHITALSVMMVLTPALTYHGDRPLAQKMFRMQPQATPQSAPLTSTGSLQGASSPSIPHSFDASQV